jgi:hypothetical protein
MTSTLADLYNDAKQRGEDRITVSRETFSKVLDWFKAHPHLVNRARVNEDRKEVPIEDGKEVPISEIWFKDMLIVWERD